MTPSARRPPTLRQLRVLRFVADHTAARGYPPTLREIATAMGICSTNGASDHLRALERRGLVATTPIVSRGLVLTDAGRALLASSAPEAQPTTTTTQTQRGDHETQTQQREPQAEG